MPSDMDQFELGLFSSLENTNIVCDQVKDGEQVKDEPNESTTTILEATPSTMSANKDDSKNDGDIST